MHSPFLRADRHLNTLASRVDVWKSGGYPGGVYAAFADALAALNELEPTQAAYCRERLERLAARVGVLLPVGEDISGSAVWRCVGVVKSTVDPWHLCKVIRALFPQPSVQARVSEPGSATVELWAAMREGGGRRWVRRVEAALTRSHVRRTVGNCLVLPTV